MKKKIIKRVSILFIIIGIVSLLYILFGEYKVKPEGISKVTVRWRTHEITINNKDEIKELCHLVTKSRFSLRRLNTGKGWGYLLKFYNSSGNIQYSFTTVGTNSIDSNSLLYQAKGLDLTKSFLDDLFKDIKKD